MSIQQYKLEAHLQINSTTNLYTETITCQLRINTYAVVGKETGGQR